MTTLTCTIAREIKVEDHSHRALRGVSRFRNDLRRTQVWMETLACLIRPSVHVRCLQTVNKEEVNQEERTSHFLRDKTTKCQVYKLTHKQGDDL